jgi:16S rRNA (adenine1518-N6/adenine1519-N6)-dimethyltransferase
MNTIFRKRFGQHFLRDLKIIDRIISAINPCEGQQLVEIGPGLGALTTKILPHVKKMHVIEIDKDLIPRLTKACQNLGAIIIHCQDVLTFDFAALIHPPQKLRVVGNLPYNISTPLLFHLFKYASNIQDMHFMLQKEVADRITAKTGNAAYGRLSIMTQYYCQTNILFTVPQKAFSPVPKVDSAFIRFIPYEKPPCPAKDITLFSNIVKRAFMKRRKTLKNALKEIISEKNLKLLGINPQTRPEQISLEEYVKMANLGS